MPVDLRTATHERLSVASALLVLSIAVVACSSNPTPSPTSSAGPPTSTPPLPSPITVDDQVWEPVTPELLGGMQLAPMVELPSALLAIGTSLVGLQPAGAWSHPTLWQSADGRSWKALPDAPALAGVADRWIDTVNAVTSDGSALIAVGAQVLFDSSSANAEAWTSPDGVMWSPSGVDDPDGAMMTAILRIADGFLAIGVEGYSAHAGGGTGTAIWTSADGRHWARSTGLSGALVTRLAAGDGGFLAAGGMAVFEGPPAPGVPIWTSPDGVKWEQVDATDAFPAGLEIQGLTWAGSSWIAVGAAGSVPMAWTSPDGRAWARAHIQVPKPSSTDHWVQMNDVAHVGSGFLAVGFEQDGGSTSALAWGSPDGVSWKLVAMPAAFDDVVLGQVAVIGGHIFVGGQQQTTGDALIWQLIATQTGRL
jgi:hypothetical protein